MVERHGIERLRWLEAPDPDVGYQGVATTFPRVHFMSPAAVQIEVAYALIEELHDALLKLSTPTLVIHGDPEFR